MLICTDCEEEDRPTASQCQECHHKIYWGRLCLACSIIHGQCLVCRKELALAVSPAIRFAAQQLCSEGKLLRVAIRAHHDELIDTVAHPRALYQARLAEILEMDRQSRADHCLNTPTATEGVAEPKSPEDALALAAELANHQKLRTEAETSFAPHKELLWFASSWRLFEEIRLNHTIDQRARHLQILLERERDLAFQLDAINGSYKREMGALSDPRLSSGQSKDETDPQTSIPGFPRWRVALDSLLCAACRRNNSLDAPGACQECGGQASGESPLCGLCSACFAECRSCRKELSLVRMPGLVSTLMSPAVTEARQIYAEKSLALAEALAAARARYSSVAGPALIEMNQTISQLRVDLTAANPDLRQEMQARSAELQELRKQGNLTPEAQASYDEFLAGFKSAIKPSEDACNAAIDAARRVYEEAVGEVEKAYEAEKAELYCGLGAEARAAVATWTGLVAPYRSAITLV